ncbi:MAG: flagellar motor switch protein FliM, partial [Syntrophomonadaceae bacterium]|nr:flagellar motor switch protein FliM [Syntrophomonadaceae bacterium]
MLSQSEIDLLLAALTSGTVSPEDMKEEEKRKKVRVYDFKRPNKFSRDQLHTIRNIHENYCRSLATYLSAMLRWMVQTNVLSVEQITYEEFIRSVADPSLINIISLDPLPGNAILEINPNIVFSIIDRLFGGPGQAPEKIRGFTEIERTVMERLVQRMIDLLRDPWATVAEISPKLEFIETNPQFAQIVSASEMIVLISIEVRLGDNLGMINLGIPYLILEPVLSRLSVHYWFSSASREEATPQTRQNLRKKLETAMLPIRVILGHSTITVAELLDLQVGDVIPLAQKVGEDVAVVVG